MFRGNYVKLVDRVFGVCFIDNPENVTASNLSSVSNLLL